VAILRIRKNVTLLEEKWDMTILRIRKDVTLLREKGTVAILRVRKDVTLQEVEASRFQGIRCIKLANLPALRNRPPLLP